MSSTNRTTPDDDERGVKNKRRSRQHAAVGTQAAHHQILQCSCRAGATARGTMPHPAKPSQHRQGKAVEYPPHHWGRYQNEIKEISTKLKTPTLRPSHATLPPTRSHSLPVLLFKCNLTETRSPSHETRNPRVGKRLLFRLHGELCTLETYPK